MWEPEKDRPCPPRGCFDSILAEHFMDIAWGLKGGLPYQPWAAALVKERLQRNSIDDPGSNCQPMGIVKNHTAPFMKKVIQIPGVVVILNEREVTYRQIFTDGRPLPVDPQPSYNGYSIGAWDGDTLVVRTSGFRDGIWLDRAGNPITPAATITERFRRKDYGHLEIGVTVDDPKAYTSPWTVTLNQFDRDQHGVDRLPLRGKRERHRALPRQVASVPRDDPPSSPSSNENDPNVTNDLNVPNDPTVPRS